MMKAKGPLVVQEEDELAVLTLMRLPGNFKFRQIVKSDLVHMLVSLLLSHLRNMKRRFDAPASYLRNVTAAG